MPKSSKRQNEEEPQEEDPKQINLLKPVQIKEFLDDYVIGQEEAEKGAVRCCI